MILLILALSIPRVLQASAANTCRTTSPGTQSYTVTLCFVDPSNGATLTNDATVNATVSVSVSTPRVTKLVFYIDNQYLVTDFQIPYTFQLPTTKWADGYHSISVEALLSDGLTSAQTSVTVSFNNGITVVMPNTNTFTPRTGTAAAPGQPFVVAAAGDGAGGEANSLGVTNQIASWNPNLFLYLGDVYEKGSPTEFLNWYGGTDKFFGQFRTITDPTIGNHEYESGVAPGYFDYWDNPPNYYSFDAGGWHFISLNSNSELPEFSPGTAQYDWLQGDLQANAGVCTIAYFHHPVFSVGPQGDTPRMDEMWSLMAQSGVTIVLTGHDHGYQRWEPLDGNGVPSATGITQFVVGGGGHGVQGFVRSDSRMVFGADSPANSYGALKLSLNSAGAGYKYINQQGTTLDSGSVTCGGAADTAPPSTPTNFTATPQISGTEVDLSWMASTDNVGVVGYDIYRDGAFLTSVDANVTYADMSVTPETNYAYAVLARDAAGNISPLTASVQVTTPPLGPIFSDTFETGDFSMWTSATGLTVQQTEVLNGTDAARGTSTGSPAWAYKQLGVDHSELFYQIHFKLVSVGANTIYLMRFRTAAGISLEGLFVNSNGTLGIRNDVAGQSSFSSIPVSTGAWHEAQLHLAVAGASSQTDVWLDGQHIDALSAPANFGSTPIGRLQLGENASGRTFDVAFDDVAAGPVRMMDPDTAPPTTPTNLGTSTPTTTEVDLTWTGSTDNVGVTGYGIYRDGSLIDNVDGATTTYQDTSATPNTAYSYTVDAVDAAGNRSPQSVPADVTTPAAPDTSPPTTPGNVAATAPSDTEVDLTWTASTDNVGVTGYTISRDGTVLTTVDGTTLSYQDVTVSASTAYQFTVDAFDAAGNHSTASGPVDITTPSAPTAATINPVVDTWVYATYPDANYGTSTQLRVDASPDTRSYLTFDIPTLSGPITQATLRVYANSAQNTGYDVHAVSDTTWDDATITYNTAPTFDVAIAGSSGPVTAGTWTEVDITSLITGPGLLSIALTTNNTTALSLASLEAGGALIPQLVLDTAPVPDTQAPTTPTNLGTSTPTTTEVDLTWTGSTDNVGVTGYGIYRDGSLIDNVDGATTTYQDTSATPNTAYSYTVDAVDAAGNRSPQSVPADVTTPAAPDTSPPTTPGNVAATAPSDTEVDLTWTASTDNVGVTGYTISRDGTVLTTVDGTTLSYQDVTVSASTAYQFTVDAFDAAGNHSTASGPVDITTPSAPTAATINPVVDTWVYATYPDANYGTSTQLRVDASPDTRSYLTFDIPTLSGPITQATLRVYANSAQNTGYDVHAVSDTTWDDATITYNTAPTFDVAIAGSSGPVTAGTWTEVDITSLITGPGLLSIALTTNNTTALSLASLEAGGALIPQLVLDTAPVPDTQAPTTPTNLGTSTPTTTEVDLTWTGSTDNVGVTGYGIYRDGSLIDNVDGATTTYQDTSATPNTAYSYTVDAVDAAGNRSPQSVPADVTTPAAPDTSPPTTPGNVAATAPSDTEVDLTWTASTDNVGVTGYTISRDGTVLTTVDGTTLSYQDVTVSASTAYQFTVDAFDAAGNHSTASGPVDITTPSAPTAATINPVVDTWVYATYPDANYGTSTQLRVDASPDTRSYLTFDIPTLSGPITQATLRVYANSAQNTGYDVHAVSDTTWDDATITYNTAPTFDVAIAGSSGPVTAGTWTEVDITSLITGPGLLSIALTTNNTTALSLASLEAGGALIPQLVLSSS